MPYSFPIAFLLPPYSGSIVIVRSLFVHPSFYLRSYFNKDSLKDHPDAVHKKEGV